MYMEKVSLDDKYTKRRGRVFMTGIQALVRLPLVQRWRDQAAGLDTAGFISGYRGSPLGGYDMELDRARKYLDEVGVHFEPGLNEDLAATSVWGTQQVNLWGQAKHDGVFGIWYGKGPGVDRSMDVLRHANAAGSTPHGGVLCIAGDDHGAKSSTLPHQTDHNFMAAFMPVLYPAGHHEFVEYGLLGLAMSRYTGAWVGFKATSETAETSGTIDLEREQHQIVMPTDFEMPDGGVHIRWPHVWRDQDWLLQRYKGFAAHAFARANDIDRVVWDSPNPKIGIMTSGKSYQDVRQALHELGIDEAKAAEIGLRLYKVGMVWPLEPEGARHFCEGLDEVLVVEEKREMIEHQLKWQLFNWREDVRPTVVGKHDEHDRWLLPAENDLTVGMVAHVIAARLAKHIDTPEIRAKLDYFEGRRRAIEGYSPAIKRVPYFCSGCPHNSSTKVPEGSRAMAGIGCHIMAINMDRSTETFTQMGGEGVPWIGQAPFTDEDHVFANLGDGTYQHSGLLAIRACVAAGVNITFKILYNDAVAMTGGQPVEGKLSVDHIAQQLAAEGVRKIAIASEQPDQYGSAKLPAGTQVHDRRDIMTLQEEFRRIEGCTAIIYDQTCAAEKRRRRKRGLMDDPPKRVFINDLVCEGCGDCSVQSNCVSVEPLETELGRKRQINQSSCNKDFSCVQGFCPSFVTVHGGDVRRTKAVGDDGAELPEVPLPTLPAAGDGYNVLVTGIGGTGVLTIGALMGMAAHLDGKASSILDMTGLAQKGGGVLSHVRIADTDDTLRSSRIITGGADVLLACDSIVAAGGDAVNVLSARRTRSVINSHLTPVADFVRSKDIDFQEIAVQSQLDKATAEDGRHRIPATELATALMGDSIATNMFVLGFAWQQGMIPLSLEALEQAIRLNRVAIDANLKTFHWGRLAAHDLDYVKKLVAPVRPPEPKLPQSLDDLVDHRATFLTGYQNGKLANRYRGLVNRIRLAEEALGNGSHALSEAVARYYFKLLAYKDEYEVARLYTSGSFAERLKAQFDGDYKLKIHLAPPLLARHDPATGRPGKMAFGGWVLSAFRVLARLKGLRGTPLDIFGYTAERRMERRLILDYEAQIDDIAGGLTADNHALAVEIASLPDMIRGFGPVKLANVDKAQAREAELVGRWREARSTTAATLDSAA